MKSLSRLLVHFLIIALLCAVQPLSTVRAESSPALPARPVRTGQQALPAKSQAAAGQLQTNGTVETFDCQTAADVVAADCLALVSFYYATDGPNWTNQANWLLSTTVEDWYGVSMLNQRVVGLDLEENALSGTLPLDLAGLQGLRTLDLSKNALSGIIPPEIGGLSALNYLDLSLNQLAGAIPTSLGNLTGLQHLDLYGNQLEGTIPIELGLLTQLTYLDLNWNLLTGSIPEQLGTLSALETLHLSYNKLSGNIPPSLGSLTNLTMLTMTGNQLSGAIPPQLGNLKKAYALFLNNNQLSGPIPASFGGLTAMMYLHMDHNQLSGSIPPELGSLSNLRYLELQNNQLSGSLPASLGSLSQLTKMYLDWNQFSGSIPSQFGNLTQLGYLRLNNNELTGPIPYQLGQLTRLVQLYLGDNYLTGPIPVALGNLSSLLFFSLRGNQLSSSIPTELGNLIKLRHLDLSRNQLTGNVPASFTNLVQLCEPGDPTFPCSAGYELNLGYNRLNVPAPEPPASFLAVKDPHWYETQQKQTYIPNAAGGVLFSYDGSTQISVPAGAAGKDFYLEYTPMPGPGFPTEDLDYAGISFDLSAYDLVNNPITAFALPLTVRIAYDEGALGGIEESNLTLYYWNAVDLSWEDAISSCPGGAYTRDTEQNWLSLPVCHLSEFALLGKGYNWLYLPLLLR